MAATWQSPINFPVAQATLTAGGYELAYNKVGFHAGIAGNATGISDWMRDLDAAGVPFFLKSADDAGVLLEAQNLAAASGVPHVIVYRNAGNDVPDYSLSPQAAAQQHWQWHESRFPPELDKSVVWLETMNELDKNRSEWLAEFSIETANLALAQGYRWAAFGWSSGEPERVHWESEPMLELLRLMGQHPERLAIALHEYSLNPDSMSDVYPYQIGRFLDLYSVADENYIPRPTVLITEWGWGAFGNPTPEVALPHIHWAAHLYAQFPEVKGAAIWYLGGGFGGVANDTQKLIAPVRTYSLQNYFPVPGNTQSSVDGFDYPPNPP